MFIERPLSEADVKRAVSDYLEVGQTQGHWLYLRLNSGSFILTGAEGNFRRRVQGTPKGTADFVVFQSFIYSSVYVTYEGQPLLSYSTKVTFLECKKSNWKPSRKPGETEQVQRDFAEQVKRMNCRYFVVRDADEVAGVLR